MEQTALSDAKTCCDKLAAHTPQPSLYAPFATQTDPQHHTITLVVEGIHCARCIWAIESALAKEGAVEEARVNMSTKRLVITWQGAAEMADHLANVVLELGYKVQPFEKRAEGKELREDQRLLRYMAVAGFAMGNLMLLSVTLWSSQQAVMGIATRDLFHLISAMIALPTILYAGRPFFSSALAVLKHGRTNMDVPISLALILACGMSLFETFNHGEHAYFDSAVMLLFFLLVGRWLDARARGKARQNAENLLSMMHGVATVIKEGGAHSIPISELREDMQVRVAVGEKIPTDAEVISGQSEIDTSLVTGETVPRMVKEGDMVYGGTINMVAPLVCRVAKPSEDSLLADIVRLMEQAEQGRATYVRMADKAARLYTPVVHSLAAAAFVGWYVFGGMLWQDALLIAITTLIITCPCALGLAVPVVQVLATSWLLKRGILVKSGDALERLAQVNAVLFDKTGTLTEGRPSLVQAPDAPSALRFAASLAVHSKHPLAQSLCASYSGDLLPASQVEEVAGKGIRGMIENEHVQLGRRSWCGSNDAPQDEWQELWLRVEANPPQRFAFTDALREDAADTLRNFEQAGMQVHLVSGDRQRVAEATAQALHVAHYQGECLPADKAKLIERLKAEGHKVLMVGDGLNDAPALAAADISIAPATGMDISQNTADMVFQGKQLAAVQWAWRMACYSTRLVKQNFALAVLYNCCAIPLAVMGYVTPLVAAIAMSSSSLIVICNSFRINLKHAWEQ